MLTRLDFKIGILFLSLFFFSLCVRAQVGKDGAKVINTVNTVVNSYSSLIADVNAGVSSILVDNNAFTTNFSTPLAAGDLVFIIQLQGAWMSYPDDPTYGEVLGYLNCGNYEFAQVRGVSGTNTVLLSCGLRYSYVSSGKTQVIRVPRYSLLTLLSNTSITCPAWNGATGGLVILEVSGGTVFNTNSSIDVSGKGFRPGTLPENLSGWGVLNWLSPNPDAGGEKGEGIAGSQADYDLMLGRYGKGAPANGGGGANAHNAGGGGGANAGLGTWSGIGVPDISTAGYVSAWNQETPPIGSSTSPGGGKGGYSMSSANMDATTTGTFNTLWGGDYRRDNGGRGGRPLDYSTGRIFMGGGGGAGDQNSSVGGVGGAGGGIVFIYSYGDISGTGSILADGADGANSGVDGAGGGGGGGTIIINSSLSVASTITLSANGGNGGDQIISLFNNECEGPGGGGGGGYIGISAGSPVRTANGGINGVTNSFAVTEFPSNGATKGGDGIANGQVNAFRIVTSPVNACAGSPLTLGFTATGTPPAGITYYWYNVPIGGSILGTGPTFTTPVLSANATYYVASCPGFARFPIQITVDRVTASYTNSSVCAGSPTTFTATATSTLGFVTGYLWNFGDGVGTGTGSNTSYTYALGGTYQAELTAIDTRGCAATVINSVTVYTSPVISFNTTASGGCSGLTVGFINNTTGGTSYSWNFGDGSAAITTSAPTHTYAGAGTYTVTLTSSNPGGCSATVSQNLTVGPRPTASFSYATNFCLNDSVRFTNTSVGNGSMITSYSWDFGDGQSSTLPNPRHRYTSAGVYNVTLTTFSGSCSDDTVISITITPSPVAAFTTTSPSGCAPYAVTFSNTSTGTTTFSWDFGDGATSTQSNPSHTYSVSGVFTVTLIAISATCPDTLIRTNYIQVGNVPTAAFSAPSGVCLGSAVSFTNSSTGNGSTITSYNWNYGNGSTSSLQSPSYTYPAAGTYTVTLTVNTSGCTNSTSSTVVVQPVPVAAFSGTPVTLCLGSSITFSNTSSGATSYFWNFGDGGATSVSSPSYQYNTAGTYTVTLTATAGICSNTFTRTSYVNVLNGPTASFSTAPTICLGDSSFFTNSSNGNGTGITSYNWSFGDGNSSSGQSPTHLYSNPGVYQVTLTATNGTCSDDSVFSVNVNVSPVVSFSTTSTTVCGQDPVVFSNTTTGTPVFTWNFGDNTSSSAASPSHIYSSPGVYTVTLIANQGTCGDTLVKPAYITVAPQPTAAFSTSNVCQGDTSFFINLSSGNGSSISSYQWSFGDGTSSSLENPNHIYTSAGNYSVTFTIGNGQCSDDTSLTVNIAARPVASFSATATNVCIGTPINFINSSTGTTNFTWLFGDGLSSTQNSPTYSYTTPGTYSVSLIASQGACIDTLVRSTYINVNTTPTASFTATGGCLGDTARFTNTSTGNGSPLLGYNWSFGDGTNSSLPSPQHYYSTPGNYTVNLTVGNGACFHDTSVSVTIAAPPTLSYSASVTRGCDSLTVNFNNSTTGASTYSWSFGDGQTSLVASPTHTYTSAGNYSVLLTATSGTGCSVSRMQMNYIQIKATPIPGFTASRTFICSGDCISFTNTTVGSATSVVWTFSGGNPSAVTSSTPSTVCYTRTGSYDVILQAANGNCTASETKSAYISVVDCGTKPEASFICSDSNLCQGSCINFSDLSVNATSWQWFFPGATPATSSSQNPDNICYSSSGSYDVRLIASNPTGSDTIDISSFINVRIAPSLPVFTQSGDTLIAPSGYAYQWYRNGIPISGAVGQKYKATLSGTYTLQVSDTFGCSSLSSPVYVSLIGIEDVVQNSDIYVYPNPATYSIHVRIPGLNDEAHLEIYDGIGRLLIEKNYPSTSQVNINLEDRLFSNGIYFIQVHTSSGFFKRSFIISR